MSIKILDVERIVVNVPFIPHCTDANALLVWQWNISEVIRITTDVP